MNITPELLKDAFSALSANEKSRMFSSDSKRDARTALTKFSGAITTRLATSLSSATPSRTIRGSFKGGKGGQSGGAAGGMKEIGEFMRAQCEAAGHAFLNKECLVDYVVSGSDLLDIYLTVESEATPMAIGTDTYDLDKLLLVSSPHRLFVGRVNVTLTGKTHKLDAAASTISARLHAATQGNHVSSTETFHAILLQTTTDTTHLVHVATSIGNTREFAFSRVVL